MRKIINVKVLEDYNLELTFDNNVVKIKDMKPHLNEGVFQLLKNKEIFNSVKITFGTISWNEDIDLCADYNMCTFYYICNIKFIFSKNI